MLIKGTNLNTRQRQQVLGAFIYRWTTGNERREEVYKTVSSSPTIPLQTDEQWLAEHAFHFLKNGSRLMASVHFCEPLAE